MNGYFANSSDAKIDSKADKDAFDIEKIKLEDFMTGEL
jgi:hypothetical protein